MPEVQLVEERSGPAESLDSAEVVIGIPSFNNASTIRAVVGSAATGLLEYFGNKGCAIIQADAGSTDGTVELARQGAAQCALVQVAYPLYPVHKLSMPYHGVPGRTVAIETIFQRARDLGATACGIISADLAEFDPRGVQAMVSPLVNEQIDFVAPLYLRHPFEGALVSGMIYPLMRSLFGRRLRYPMATDFAVSSRLLVHLLAQDVWKGDINAEVWLPSEAMSGEFKIGQALLAAKSAPRESARDLTSTLDQVAGPVFAQMQQRVAVWQRSRPAQPVPVFGSSDTNRVEPIAINPAPMMESFRLACQTLPDIWGVVLPPATLLALKKLGRVPESQFLLSDDLWARIVYDFAVGYRLRALGRDHLMGALAPLYLAWLASFALEVGKAPLEDAEARLEILSLAFESEKPYLISRWRWPDRFNP